MATKTPWMEMWDRSEPKEPVLAALMKGEPVSANTHPTFVRDVTLESDLELSGYEFLTNEFAVAVYVKRSQERSR